MKTIGYGHACQSPDDCNKINPPITEAEGLVLLKSDAAEKAKCVDSKVTVPVSPPLFPSSLSHLLAFPIFPPPPTLRPYA